MPNYNEITGLPYGVIAIRSLDPDVADALMFGPQARDLWLEQAREELREKYESEYADVPDSDDLVERLVEDAIENVASDEAVIEGEYEGVKYRIDWLGGAPILMVFDGPVCFARSECSPCVPGAVDLDSGFSSESVGDFFFACHGIPQDWLGESDEDQNE